MRTTAQLCEENIKNPRYEAHLKRCSGTKEALENFTLPSTEDIEEMVMKAKGDAEKDLNQLGVAVDGEKCFDFYSKLVRRIVNSNEEEMVDECEECEPLSSENEEDDEHDQHDMDVLRTVHDADFREFHRWQSKSSEERPNSEQSCTSIESTAFVQIPDASGNIRIVKKKFNFMVFRRRVCAA